MTHETKKQDAKCLVDEFGVTPQAAAELVIEPGGAADELAIGILVEQHEVDPLSGVPVPGSGRDPAHEETGIEDMEKPVDHTISAAT